MLIGVGGYGGIEDTTVVYKLGIFALDIVKFIGRAVAAGEGYSVLGQDYLRSLTHDCFFLFPAGFYIGISVSKTIVVDANQNCHARFILSKTDFALHAVIKTGNVLLRYCQAGFIFRLYNVRAVIGFNAFYPDRKVGVYQGKTHKRRLDYLLFTRCHTVVDALLGILPEICGYAAVRR